MQNQTQNTQRALFYFFPRFESTQLARQVQQKRVCLVVDLLCRHTASNPFTSGTHTSGAQ